jgi:CheY-like chemotaxis protein
METTGQIPVAESDPNQSLLVFLQVKPAIVSYMEIKEFNSLKGLRVLVAEDNIFTQRLISLILSQWEVSVDVVSNGRAAVEMVVSNIYDAVIMDIMMPEMDGYDASRAIRSMDGMYFKQLPIFACSAIADADQLEMSGMTGFISKSPLTKEELYEILCPIFSKHKIPT